MNEEIKSKNYHLLFIIKGQVKLQRSTWSDFFSVSSGTYLNDSDLLLPTSGSNIVVLCDDLNLWMVPSNVKSGVTNGCSKTTEPIITRPQGNIGNTRGTKDPTTPYVISPRSTKIINSKPLIIWNPVPQTEKYIVQIEENGNLIWNAETDRTQISYPGEPNLKRETSYLVKIMSDTGISSEDNLSIDSTFKLINQTEEEEITSLTEKISSLDLSSEQKDYAVAALYASKGFDAESNLLLDKIVANDTKNVQAILNLGKGYLKIGLPLNAKTYFEKTIELAETNNDIESMAQAQEALAQTLLDIGRRDDGIQMLLQAEASFKSLGDNKHSEKLKIMRIKITS